MVEVTVADRDTGQVFARDSYSALLVNEIVVTAGDGHDWIVNDTAVPDTIHAGDGRDFVRAGDGESVVSGGSGNDRIYGGDGRDSLVGGTGDDVIYGNADNDILEGGYGDDFLYGGSFGDQLRGGAGNDFLFVGSNHYSTWTNEAGETLRSQDGGSGHDTLAFSAERDGRWYVMNEDGLHYRPEHLLNGEERYVFGATDTNVTALATGDTNGDGREEIYTAVEVDGRVEVHRSDSPDETGSPIWVGQAADWSVQAIALGDVDGNRRDELYIGLEHRSSGDATIYRSQTGTSLGRQIWGYDGDRDGGLTIKALAAGDTDGNNRDELFIGLHRGNGSSYVYRSDTGEGIGRYIWRKVGRDAGKWAVQALAVGDVNESGTAELYTGLESIHGGAYIYQSESGLGIGDRIWQSSGSKSGTWTVQALATGDVEGDGATELFVGLEHREGGAHLFRSNDGDRIGSRIWSTGASEGVTIRALAVGDIGGEDDAALFNGVDHSGGEAMVHRYDGPGTPSTIYDTLQEETGDYDLTPATPVLSTLGAVYEQVMSTSPADGSNRDATFAALLDDDRWWNFDETGSNTAQQVSYNDGTARFHFQSLSNTNTIFSVDGISLNHNETLVEDLD